MLTLHPSNRTQEYAAVEDNYCPALHRINQVVRHRAIYPDQPPPPVPPILLKYAQPDQDLVEQAQTVLADLIETAQVKKGRSPAYHLKTTPMYRANT